ncbi:T-cell surface protein tactile isoform X2 [Crotalus tigris]|uniref:T-cell surface protein tactile isoform X2 n=1 Tax=Crotalus tigris TaxID=88082 RepID=UPI00192F98FC|nr:T-cell surface protein tactile isoform X2 [Crotalus tigris]
MGFQVFYLLILACVLNGCTALIITNEKTVCALAGSSVTLKCSILQGKETHVTQIQWSKFADGLSRIIAVYNPLYGTKYSEAAYNNSASFEKGFHDCLTDFSRTSKEVNSVANNLECNQWILQLKNVTFELSGSYECIFTTFPTGTSSSKIHLFVKKREYKNSVLQALLNQSLEILCMNSMPSYINLTNASVTWSLKENGTEKILIKKQSYYLQGYTANNLTVYKDRIQMSSKNALLISPVTVIDDGKTFVCSIAAVSGRIQESATQVKTFAKPEISIVLHTVSKGKAHFTCMIKKAYPKPKLMWYMGGKILNEKSEGLLIKNKATNRVGSFYERTSFLSIWNITHPSINQTFKCMSSYHFTRNDRKTFSSKEILITYGFQNASLAYSEFTSHITAISDSPTERLQTTLSEASKATLVSDSSSEKHLHSIKTLQSDTTEKLFSDSTVPQKILHSTKTLQSTTTTVLLHDSTVPQKSTQTLQNDPITAFFSESTVPQSESTIPQRLKNSRITTHQNAATVTHFHENSMPPQRNLPIGRVIEVTTVNSPANSYTIKNGLDTGSTMVPKHSTFPWSIVVAFLLFFCTCLIICGIRKWCQHQREIMNKPPSFKPPPPPVKYSSIQVYNEIYSSCDELENLKSA